MALLSVQRAAIGGQTITYAAASAGGDTFKSDDRAMLLVKNGDTSSHTATVAVPGNTKFGQAEPDVAVTVAAGAEKAVGPFPVDLSDPADGLVHVTYDAVTSVTVALVGV